MPTNYTRFLNEISTLKKITFYQEYILSNIIHSTTTTDTQKQDAAVQLASSAVGFIVSFAKNYANDVVPLTDLIAVGYEAAFKATAKYIPTKRFISFAVYYVRNAFVSELYTLQQTIRQPHMIRVNSKKYNKIISDYFLIHGCIPTEKYVQDKISINDTRIFEEINLQDYMTSYNVPSLSKEEYVESIPDTPKPLSNDLINDILENKLNSLEALIIRQLYGYNDMEYEISDIVLIQRLELTRKEYYQVKDTAINKIKYWLEHE